MEVKEVELALYKYALANDEYGDFEQEDDFDSEDFYVPTASLYSWLADKLYTYRDAISIEVDDLGTVSQAEQFGGEGQGDQYYLVLKVENGEGVTYWRINGWYASYDGGPYDGDLYQAKPVEKVVVEYEPV